MASSYELHIEHNVDPSDDESHLALLRYPAMKSHLSNPPDLIHFQMKPKSMKLKLEVSLDKNSPNFCPTQAHIIAGKSIPKTFPESMANKNFYSSTRTAVDDSQLFVGQFMNGKLVCRPLASIYSLRSDFSHLDVKEEIDIKEEVRPISVKFATTDRRNTNPKVEDNHETEESLDHYRSLSFDNSISHIACAERTYLFGKPIIKIKVDPDAKPETSKQFTELLPDIKPKIETSEIQNVQPKANIIKKHVKDCLLKAKVVTFDEIHRFLRNQARIILTNPDVLNKDILDALAEYALLVQGNWAVKSELLHGDSSIRDCTDVTGISINLFNSARDYLLWLFTQNRFVNRLEYTRQVKMPDHDVLELFNQVSTLNRAKHSWEFKLPTDKKFMENFPDTVQRQNTFWKVRRANKLSLYS